jgi:hypothetical protein
MRSMEGGEPVTRRLSLKVRLALAGLWASMIMLGLASGLGVLGLPDTVPSVVARTTTTTTTTSTTSTKAKCNSGNGNGSETVPSNDCDPGNSGGHNNGGD